LTNERESMAAEVAGLFGDLEPTDALDCPYLLVGDAEFLAGQVLEFEQRWGIRSYCVRPDAQHAAAAILRVIGRG